jgi:hypothetical protein
LDTQPPALNRQYRDAPVAGEKSPEADNVAAKFLSAEFFEIVQN